MGAVATFDHHLFYRTFSELAYISQPLCHKVRCEFGMVSYIALLLDMNSSGNLPTVANDPFLRSFDAELSRANRDLVRSVELAADRLALAVRLGCLEARIALLEAETRAKVMTGIRWPTFGMAADHNQPAPPHVDPCERISRPLCSPASLSRG